MTLTLYTAHVWALDWSHRGGTPGLVGREEEADLVVLDEAGLVAPLLETPHHRQAGRHAEPSVDPPRQRRQSEGGVAAPLGGGAPHGRVHQQLRRPVRRVRTAEHVLQQPPIPRVDGDHAEQAHQASPALSREEAALLRALGATRQVARDPVWPVLGPPQGIWPDIWPLGEPRVHEPIYKHSNN